jgi:hypothetical protein
MSSAAAVPPSTTLSTLRTRRDAIARHVTRCEANVERLRSELALPPIFPGATPPAERAMIVAVRDLVEARARLAQISGELRRAEGA